MSESHRKNWAVGAVMSMMVVGVSLAIWNAGRPQYAPKPNALGDYVIHAGNDACLATLMKATAGRSDMKDLDVGSFLRLREIADKCGGRVESIAKK